MAREKRLASTTGRVPECPAKRRRISDGESCNSTSVERNATGKQDGSHELFRDDCYSDASGAATEKPGERRMACRRPQFSCTTTSCKLLTTTF